MYMTRKLGTIPYQCYMPRPLIPEIRLDLRRKFEALERRLVALNARDDLYMDACARIIAQTRNKYRSTDRDTLARHAANMLLKTRCVGASQLIKIHSRLTGTGKPGLRTGLAWVGSQHPGNSWHVGSPPEHLKSLVKDLASFDSKQMPSILWATTAMLRILQIHPFADGNGRVARFYALWAIYNRIGPSLIAASAIDALFDRSQVDLQSLSLESQAAENFDAIFDLVAEKIDLNLEHIRSGEAACPLI